MRERIISALKSVNIEAYLINPINFPMLLRGGYEDNLSMQIFLSGFKDNSDLVAQYSLGDRNCVDIVKEDDGRIVSLVEFGHQFSLQFNANSGLDKLQSDAGKRLQEITTQADLYTVQIITDVVNLTPSAMPNLWCSYYQNRYNIARSLTNRTEAEERIIQIFNTINQFNQNFFLPEIVPIGEHIKVNITNRYGRILVHFIINGPYDYNKRVRIYEANN